MRQNSRHNNLFMLELIISIFFFIICTTVCIQLFIQAHLMSKKTNQLNNAIFISQNLAEQFIGNEGNFTFIKDNYLESNLQYAINLDTEDELLIFFDDKGNYQPTDSNAFYYAFISFSQDENYGYEDIYVGNYTDLETFTQNMDTTEFVTRLKNFSFHNISIQKYLGGS